MKYHLNQYFSFISGALLDDDVLVDGGLVANAPETFARLIAAEKRWPLPLTGFQMLSIGTAGAPSGGAAGDVPQSGAKWASGASIVKLVLSSQEPLALAQCESPRQSGCLRIDQRPSQRQLVLQAMDKVDASMTATLRKLAKDAIEAARKYPPAWALPLL